MKKRQIKIIQEILFKLAQGFEFAETVDEYSPNKEDGSMELTKRKITTHYVAPDMLAIKMLLGENDQSTPAISQMTDKELIELKEKLVKEIFGGENKNDN